MFWDRQKSKLVSAISVLLVMGFLVTSFASYYVSRSSLRSEISLNALPLTSDNIYSEIQHDLLRPDSREFIGNRIPEKNRNIERHCADMFILQTNKRR